MKNYWKTKDGEIIKISAMEDSHIENCIKLLKRRIGFIESDFSELLSFPLPSGEIALDIVEQGLAEYSKEKDEVIKKLEDKIKKGLIDGISNLKVILEKIK